MSTPQEEIEQFEHVTRQEVVEAAKNITLDTVYLLTQKQEDNADEN
jgi:predicted Zn-dependent peptidase